MNSSLWLFAFGVLAFACVSASVTVTSVVSLGNQSDPHLAPTYPSRDGGAVGSLGGKIVWFWSDTTYTKNGAFAGFYGNTGAYGTAGNPLLLNGPQQQAIPFTSQEQAFNNAHSNNPRVVLWPKSGVIETSAGVGVIFVPKGYWGSTSDPTPNRGIVVANVTIGANGPVVTRLSDTPIFPDGTPSYGSVAAAKDSNYLYLYSADKIDTYTSATYLARVPLSSATTKSSFQYYNAATKTWGSVAPATSDKSKAIFTTTFGIDGNVFYSSYLKQWILIFNYRADGKVNLRSAPAPEGPWSQDTLLYTPPPSSVSYIYGTTGTDLYDTTGKSAAVDFTWCYNGGYANWVLKVNFQ